LTVGSIAIANVIIGCYWAKAVEANAWTYAGDGYSSWQQWGECNNGTEQSPVNLKNLASLGTPVKSLVFKSDSNMNSLKYVKEVQTLGIAGHKQLNAIKVFKISYSGSDGHKIIYDDEEYKFYEMLVHAKSEHKVNNDLFDAEIQLFFKDDDNEKAAVSFLLKKGEHSSPQPALLQKLIGLIRDATTSARDVPNFKDVDPKKLFELDGLNTESLVVYDGSLTIPPCTESIKWFVFTEAAIVHPDFLTEEGGIQDILDVGGKYTLSPGVEHTYHGNRRDVANISHHTTENMNESLKKVNFSINSGFTVTASLVVMTLSIVVAALNF